MRSGKSYVLPVMAILCIIAFLTYMGISNKKSVPQTLNNKDYDVLMALDFEKDYPATPNGVLEAYNQIERFLSGNLSDGFTDEDLKILLEKQRQLMDAELLSINPIESQLKLYKEKLDYIKEMDVRILQIKIETPLFSEDAKSCSITAKQFWSKHNSINLVYNLTKEPETNKWKIKGWEAYEAPPEG